MLYLYCALSTFCMELPYKRYLIFEFSGVKPTPGGGLGTVTRSFTGNTIHLGKVHGSTGPPADVCFAYYLQR